MEARRFNRLGWLAGLLLAAGGFVAVAAGDGPPAAALPSSAPSSAPSSGPSDAQVDQAIRRGVQFLYSRQKPDGAWPARTSRSHPGGAEALAVLAALSAREDANGPEIQLAMKYLAREDLLDSLYGHAAAAMAYARLGGKDSAKRLADQVDWIVRHQDKSGGWGYGRKKDAAGPTADYVDSSNTWMATWALSQAAAAGADVPPAVWAKAQGYWLRSQNDDDGWGYQPRTAPGTLIRPASYGTMTVAAVASLWFTVDRLGPDVPSALTAARGEAPRSPREAIDRGTKWLGRNFTGKGVPQWIWGASDDWIFYYDLALAALADECGDRTFSGKAWWPLAAGGALATQLPDGSWAGGGDLTGDSYDPVVRTALGVLMLSRGRPPLVVGKLDLEGLWADDRQDIANFARWYSREVAPAGWQRIAPASGIEVFAEAPVLYVRAGAKWGGSDTLTEAQAAYVRGLGTLVVQAPGTAEAGAIVARLLDALPGMRVVPLADDHPIFRLRYRVDRSDVTALSDGLRTRLFVFASDLGGRLNRGPAGDALPAFQQLANIVAYATDSRPLVGQLDAGRPPVCAPASTRIAVARVCHAGNWDLCPAAAARVSDVLAGAINVGIEPGVADMNQPLPPGLALLWMTGAADPNLSADQVARIKNYVQAGGTVLVDSAGSTDFLTKATAALAGALGTAAVPLPPDHPVFTGRFAGGLGANAAHPRFNRWTDPNAASVGAASLLMQLPVNGRPAVIISSCGLTCAAEGLPAYGVPGLMTDDARRLAANIVLFAASR